MKVKICCDKEEEEITAELDQQQEISIDFVETARIKVFSDTLVKALTAEESEK